MSDLSPAGSVEIPNARQTALLVCTMLGLGLGLGLELVLGRTVLVSATRPGDEGDN